MAETAHVASVDAIEAFRAKLIVYAAKMAPLLEDAIDEVSRTREWLRGDRQLYWANQLRQRARALEEARHTLFSAELTRLRPARAEEIAAERRAKAAVAEAEEKLRMAKKWSSEFDHRAGPLVKQLERVRNALGQDLPKAVLHLGEVVKALEAYANVARPAAAPVTGEAATGEATGEP